MSGLQHTARRLRRAPGYTAIVITVLALCIGAVTAIFSVVYGVLLKPYGFAGRGQLVVWNETMREMSAAMPLLPVNYRHFHYLSQHAHTLSYSAMVAGHSSSLSNGKGHPEMVPGLAVTQQFFQILGQPLIGRSFLPDEYRHNSAPVLILTDATARRYFGSAEAALGRTLNENGRTLTIVGVTPRGFRLPVLPIIPGRSGSANKPYGVFEPFAPTQQNIVTSDGDYNYLALARLRPGVTIPQAQAELDTLEKQMQKADRLSVHLGVVVTPFADAIDGGVSKPLLFLLLAVGGVLLIGCVNLANLQLARSVSLSGEHALRAALGAAPGRLIAESLAENLLLAAAGLVFALPVAWAGTRALVALAPPQLPRINEIHLSLPVMGAAVGLSLLTCFLFGVVPAWRAATADPLRALSSGGVRIAGEGRGATRLRNALLMSEIACSVMLLAGTGLLAQSFGRLLSNARGLSSEPVTMAQVSLSDARYDDVVNGAGENKGIAVRNAFIESSLARLRSLPGVQAAAVTSVLPLTGVANLDSIRRPDHPLPMGEQPIVNERLVSPGYFEALGIPLVSGRGFDPADRNNRKVAVLSESAARLGFPGQTAMGHLIGKWDSNYTVIGIAADARINDPRKNVPIVYLPVWEYPPSAPTFLVRGAGIQGTEIQRAIWSVDPQVVISTLLPLHVQTSRALALERFQMLLVSSFGAVALLLAALGVYGVLSYGVALRTREWGVRLALGSGRGRLTLRVLRGAAFPAVSGAIVGCAGAWMLSVWLRSLLYGFNRASGLPVLAISLSVMAAAILLAALPSALRAARTEPATVLRGE